MENKPSVVVGIVVDLDDKEGLGRVKVRFPYLGDELSNWARVASVMAGKGRGVLFRPEPDDEVLVAFEHGDPRRPYVLGAVWNGPDPPPKDDGKAKENNWRIIVSRSGHVVKLDDTRGSEKVEIIAAGGDQAVVLDMAGKKLRVEAGSGDVEVTAQSGSVSIEAARDLSVHARGRLTVLPEGDRHCRPHRRP